MENIQKDIIYNLICNNKRKFVHVPYGKIDDYLCKFLLLHNIILPVKTVSDVYEFLTEHRKEDKKCGIPDCYNDRRKITNIFPKFGKDFYKFCSPECDFKYKSIRQTGLGNTFHKTSVETRKKSCQKQSIKMKQLILDGLFTPTITNRWTHSRISVQLFNKIINVRSSWEAYFLICNPDLLYEKIRIPYFIENINKIYIVDFVDDTNKILYEIKPEKTKNNITKLKEIAAINWANSNGYTYKVISDNWFKNNYNPDMLIGQPDADKIYQLLKQFNK